METARPPKLGLKTHRFKSHHSGMETLKRCSRPAGARSFKSHHSGMETLPRVEPQRLQLLALNRTIVGWKPSSRPRATRKPQVFKSHHSGMETAVIKSVLGRVKAFKSHHSGMETLFMPPGQATKDAALNRTIVGWKHMWERLQNHPHRDL